MRLQRDTASFSYRSRERFRISLFGHSLDETVSHQYVDGVVTGNLVWHAKLRARKYPTKPVRRTVPWTRIVSEVPFLEEPIEDSLRGNRPLFTGSLGSLRH